MSTLQVDATPCHSTSITCMCSAAISVHVTSSPLFARMQLCLSLHKHPGVCFAWLRLAQHESLLQGRLLLALCTQSACRWFLASDTRQQLHRMSSKPPVRTYCTIDSNQLHRMSICRSPSSVSVACHCACKRQGVHFAVLQTIVPKASHIHSNHPCQQAVCVPML
jgi:hypothetical protein